jgi:class 3 adenylate cyclase
VPARDVLLTLNQLFSIFDRLAERHGLEKIKTMGDSYIAAAGAPVARDDHADAAVAMAIDMHREVERLAGLRRRTLSIRIGISSGPVTAGVIGRQKFAYDLWGDTVNVASRMEQFGLPGKIQVSESTQALLTSPYPWTERSVQVKGKGLMTTFVLDPADVPAARPIPMAELEPLRESPAEGLPSLAVS